MRNNYEKINSRIIDYFDINNKNKDNEKKKSIQERYKKMSEKRILEMDCYEQKVLANILNDKRKSLIEENKDNDFIDEILEKVIDAPIKKKSLFKKDKRDER